MSASIVLEQLDKKLSYLTLLRHLHLHLSRLWIDEGFSTYQPPRSGSSHVTPKSQPTAASLTRYNKRG